MSLRQVQIMPLSTMMEQVLSQVVPYGPLVTKEWLRPLQQVQANLTLWLISQEVQGTPLQSLIALEMLLQQRQQRLHLEMWSSVPRA